MGERDAISAVATQAAEVRLPASPAAANGSQQAVDDLRRNNVEPKLREMDFASSPSPPRRIAGPRLSSHHRQNPSEVPLQIVQSTTRACLLMIRIAAAAGFSPLVSAGAGVAPGAPASPGASTGTGNPIHIGDTLPPAPPPMPRRATKASAVSCSNRRWPRTTTSPGKHRDRGRCHQTASAITRRTESIEQTRHRGERHSGLRVGTVDRPYTDDHEQLPWSRSTAQSLIHVANNVGDFGHQRA